MQLETTFTGAHGAALAARIERPPGAPRAWALFAHCFTCTKDLQAARQISASLAARGYGVLRFDFTGQGESEGEFADTNFSSNVEDLLAAVAFLRAEHEAPRLLIGHSLGGAAVLAAASEVPEAVAVATIGAPFEPAHVRKLLCERAPELAHEDEAEVVLAGRRFRIKRQLIDDLVAQNQPERIAKLGKALLICHAPFDQVVGVDNARQIFAAAKHPKSFVSLDDADHLLTRPADAEYVSEVVAAWAARYLPPVNEEALPHGEVTVEGGSAGYAQRVRLGAHTFWADEPSTYPGGTDTGPSPYELLLAGLGACTSMTLRMYADRKGWPLEGVHVWLDHQKIHAKDCEDCDGASGRLDEIQRVVTVKGPLDAEQRARLLEIADRCPVHRTLLGEIKIRTRAGEE